MSEPTQWEYRVEIIGATLRGTKAEEIEVVLNEWGEEGWEAINVFTATNSNKVTIVSKRPLTSTVRRRRSRASFP